MSSIALDPTGTFGRPLVLRPARTTAAQRTPAPRVRGTVTAPARTGASDLPAGHGAGLRLTRRGRLAVTLGALVLAGAALFSAQDAEAEAPAAAVAVSTHTVAPGDTLWSVARTAALPGEDLRDVVDELIQLNGLAGASLQVGQMLLVPER